MYRNGTRLFYGSHVKMPNHELYQEDWYTNGIQWAHYGAARVFTHKAVGPQCPALAKFTACKLKKYQHTR